MLAQGHPGLDVFGKCRNETVQRTLDCLAVRADLRAVEKLRDAIARLLSALGVADDLLDEVARLLLGNPDAREAPENVGSVAEAFRGSVDNLMRFREPLRRLQRVVNLDARLRVASREAEGIPADNADGGQKRFKRRGSVVRRRENDEACERFILNVGNAGHVRRHVDARAVEKRAAGVDVRATQRQRLHVLDDGGIVDEGIPCANPAPCADEARRIVDGHIVARDMETAGDDDGAPVARVRETPDQHRVPVTGFPILPAPAVFGGGGRGHQTVNDTGLLAGEVLMPHRTLAPGHHCVER